MGGYPTAFYLGQFSATLIIISVLAYVGSCGGMFLFMGAVSLIIALICAIGYIFVNKFKSSVVGVSD